MRGWARGIRGVLKVKGLNTGGTEEHRVPHFSHGTREKMGHLSFDLGERLGQGYAVGSSPSGGGVVASSRGVAAVIGCNVIAGGDVGASGGSCASSAGAGLVQFGSDVAGSSLSGGGASLVDESE